MLFSSLRYEQGREKMSSKTRSTPFRSGKTAVLLTLVLLLGSGLRFQGITKTGPYLWDDASFHMGALWIESVSRCTVESVSRLADEYKARYDRMPDRATRDTLGPEIVTTRLGRWSRAETIELFRSNIEGYPFPIGKHFHSVLIALLMQVAGHRPFAGNLLSALLSIPTLLVTFLLGRRLYGTRVGLFAAFLLAVSGYHVLYSRAGLAEISFSLFTLLALHCYFGAREVPARGAYERLLATGLLWGVAVITHERALGLSILLWIFEIHYWVAARPVTLKMKIYRLVFFVTGLAIPLVIVEIPYHLYYIAAGYMDVTPSATSFIVTLAGRILIGGAGLAKLFHFETYKLAVYPTLYYMLNGPVICALILVGLVVMAKERRREDFLLLLWFLLPIVAHTRLIPIARYVSFTLPAAALIGARWICTLYEPRAGSIMERLRERKGLVCTLVVAAVLVSGTACSIRMIRSIHTGYPAAAAFIEGRDEAMYLAPHHMSFVVYLDQKKIRQVPATEEELSDLHHEGYRYLLVDCWKYFLIGRTNAARRELIEVLEAALIPAAILDNPFARYDPVLYEGAFFLDAYREVALEKPPGLSQIRIYDLDDYFCR